MKDYGKLWDKTTSTLFTIRRGLCDAYDLGYKDGEDNQQKKNGLWQDEGYKKGLKDAWRHIKDIIEIWKESDDGETKDIFGYEDLTDIVNKLEVDEAFDKLEAYKKSKNNAPEVANCRKCKHSTECATDLVVCDINGTTQYKWHLGCKDYDPKEVRKCKVSLCPTCKHSYVNNKSGVPCIYDDCNCDNDYKDYDPITDAKIEVGDEVIYDNNNEKYIVTWVGFGMVNAIKQIDGSVVGDSMSHFTKTGMKFVDISLEMLIGEKP